MEFWFKYFASKKTFSAIIGVGIFTTIAVGTIVTILLANWATIDTQQEQTGYRGVGMVQFKPEADLARLAVLNEVPESEEPYIPEEGDALAKDVYENVQVLGDVTEDNFNRLMLAITEWVSPEQGCAYCHGLEGNFASDEYYPKMVARRMIQMTQNTNENWQSHVAPAGVTCYTCHRGQPVPEYNWNIEPRPAGSMMLGDNTMRQNRADETVGYSSLPGDPLTAFLLNEREIRVNNDVPRAANEGGPMIQDAEWTYALMFHFSSSLGVNCTNCHNSRAWGSWEQSPPTRVKAWYAIRMLRDLNQNYMHNLTYYPPERLGPLGDPAKASCMTCHQGVNKPLYGANMVQFWPELQKSGVPDYSQPADSAEAPAVSPDKRAEAETTVAK
jgi:photosynthetic reaction center cytochrome c subunit